MRGDVGMAGDVIVLRNGESVDGRSVAVDAAGEALCLGHSLFETMLVRTLGAHGLFRPEAHVARLIGSAERLGWRGTPRAHTLRAWIEQAARAFREAHPGCGRLRLTVAWAKTDRPPDVLVTVVPYRVPETPAKVVTTEVRVPWTYVAGFPAPKSGSRLTYSFAERFSVTHRCDEALLVDGDGNLVEGAKSNLFAAYDTHLATAPVSCGILPGIARDTLLALATEEGVRIEERPLSRGELLDGCSVLLTNALWGVRLVGELDGRPLTCESDLVARLADRFRREVVRLTV